MKKEKTVKTYQRRTKSGKMVTVRQHTASYDAAEKAKGAAKRKGAGDELTKKKAEVEESPLGFSEEDYKAWYHWDQDSDPKNKAALKVAKALRAQMGRAGYNKYFNEMTDKYSPRGHISAYKNVSLRMPDTSKASKVKPEKQKSEKTSIPTTTTEFKKAGWIFKPLPAGVGGARVGGHWISPQGTMVYYDKREGDFSKEMALPSHVREKLLKSSSERIRKFAQSMGTSSIKSKDRLGVKEGSATYKRLIDNPDYGHGYDFTTGKHDFFYEPRTAEQRKKDEALKKKYTQQLRGTSTKTKKSKK